METQCIMGYLPDVLASDHYWQNYTVGIRLLFLLVLTPFKSQNKFLVNHKKVAREVKA